MALICKEMLNTHSVLSLTYGRPLMIDLAMTQNKLVLPSPIDDQFLTRVPDSPGSQSENIPSLTECYVESIKLQDILGQVLVTFYYGGGDNNNGDAGNFDPEINYKAASVIESGIKDSDLQMLLNVDGSLTAWHKRLPAHLKVQTYENEETSGSLEPGRIALFRRQATVLEARYVTTIICLQGLASAFKKGKRGKANSILKDIYTFDW